MVCLGQSRVSIATTLGLFFASSNHGVIAQQLYFATSTGIYQSNADGTGIREIGGCLRGGYDTPKDLTLDIESGKLYWLGSVSNTIMRSNLDGSAVEYVVSGLDGWPTALAVDSTHRFVYWSEWDSHQGASIHRANLDWPDRTVILASEGRIEELSIDAVSSELRFSTNEGLFRAAIDGTDCRIVRKFSGDVREAIETKRGGSCGGCGDYTKRNLRFIQYHFGGNPLYPNDLLMSLAFTPGLRLTGATIDAQLGKAYISTATGMLCGPPSRACLFRASLDGNEIEELLYGPTGCESFAFAQQPIALVTVARRFSGAWPAIAAVVFITGVIGLWRKHKKTRGLRPMPRAIRYGAYKRHRMSTLGFFVSGILIVLWLTTLCGAVGYRGWRGYWSIGGGAFRAQLLTNPVPIEIRDRFIQGWVTHGWRASWNARNWWANIAANSLWHAPAMMGLRLPRRNWNPRLGLSLELPLWVLVAPLAVASAFFWCADRRRAKTGLCQSCGYNLTGNTSGRCPESGAACARPALMPRSISARTAVTALPNITEIEGRDEK